MDNSSLSQWFPRTEEGVYYSNKNNPIDDFTTQKSTISEDQETSELSITPDSTRANSRSYFHREINKSKVSKIDFSLLENCPIGSKRRAIDHDQPKLNNNKSISSSSPRFLSFNNNNNNNMDSIFPSHQGCKIEALDEMYLCDLSDQKFSPYLKSNDKRVGKKIPLVDHDHIIAERKRREKLSQRFVALSAILPGLKKADKASILEQAIKHVKELKEKVQHLEEEKKSTESVMFVNKSKLEMNKQVHDDDDEYSSSDENNNNNNGSDIEVRFSDNNVLIRITCARRNAFVLNIHNEIEKLHLTIVQSCMMPFGKQAIDITLVAQMEASFCITLKDLAKHVRMVTGRLMTQA